VSVASHAASAMIELTGHMTPMHLQATYAPHIKRSLPLAPACEAHAPLAPRSPATTPTRWSPSRSSTATLASSHGQAWRGGNKLM
jgi:hypothetical protein